MDSGAAKVVKILLIGNYAPDGQESMLRYADLLRTGLAQAGHDVLFTAPRTILNVANRPASGAWKWIGYLDKYLLSPPALAQAARSADIVHICDHSNSVYVPSRSTVPYVVTCHDLLAVRGALGDETDCPASIAGRQLQKRILSGLSRAHALACVSGATLLDARRLLKTYAGQLVLTPNSLNYCYGVLDSMTATHRLSGIAGLHANDSYVLHVGSNLRRKNRATVLKAIASVANVWDGKVVFAGQPLDAELREQAAQLHIQDRIVEVIKPCNEVLEALYGRALALLFPSRFEGFGWPIIEAQACGCPVICSDREPLTEVSGGAALLCGADDAIAQGQAILKLVADRGMRAALIADGRQNVRRYEQQTMIKSFLNLYHDLGAAA